MAAHSVEGESDRETTIEITESYEDPIGMPSNTYYLAIFSVFFWGGYPPTPLYEKNPLSSI